LEKKYNILILIVLISVVILTISYNQQILSNQEDKYPSWVEDLIAKEESGSIANPPASLTKCVYKNQIVYYLSPRCCDIYSVLYNESGDVICAPDGGLTGGGDGRCPDFFEKKENCEVIWKDSRPYP
jgi:hypothetical protein